MAACLERVEQGQHAFKKAQIVGVGLVVMPIALTQCRVFVNRHIRCGMGQCLHQAQADHIACSLVSRDGSPHIAYRRLDAAGDDFGGIKQGAIPVEGDQVKIAVLHALIVARPDCYDAEKLAGLTDRKVLRAAGQKLLQLIWQRGLQAHRFARLGVVEFQAPGMEKHAL